MYARRATYSKARLPAALFERDFSLATLGADAAFTRASTGYVMDYQGVLHEVPINIPRFEGARVIKNLLGSIDFNLSGSYWVDYAGYGTVVTGGQTDPLGGSTAYKIDFPGVAQSGIRSQNPTAFLPGTYAGASVWLWASEPTAVRFAAAAVTEGVVELTLTTTPTRYSVTMLTGEIMLNRGLRLINPSASPSSFYAWRPQSEYAFASGDPCSEWIAPGAFEYRDTTNGNTVNGSTNAVTEAAGTKIAGIRYLNEPGSTNICGKVTSDPASATGSGATFAAYTSGLGVPTGKLIASTGTELHYVTLGTITPTAGASYCVSAYVKKLGYPIIRTIMADDSTGKIVLFNLDTLEVVVGSSGEGLSDYGIEPAGDGFYRIWLAGLQSVASNRGCQIYIQCSDTYNYPDSTPGDGVNGLIFGGWQVEELPYPTSFIATTSASPVSRAADGLSYAGVPADNETRIVVDGAASDTDDWDGVVDEEGLISRIQVYAPGGRP